ncbi:MAG TPA: aminotransferase class III-fold pyridoxal phosphate-dependent enzyme [Acidimicrobiales bacterium]|nr:aminotransferase class III-fold pyridoxal phosphate-dependent enzyme [Acidimicrobiales bacterium]
MTALDSTTTSDWLERHSEVVAPVLPGYFDVVADHAEGSWVWDVDGRRYLDLGSGIAVTNTGHRHPHVVAAIHAQVDKLLHTSVVVKHQPYVQAAEAIARLAPFLDHPQVFFCNSGAEAVDGVMKLARRATGRPGVMAFQRAFHGRTMAATGITTAKASYQDGYGPFLPHMHVAPYCVPGATSAHPDDEAAVVAEALAGLDEALAAAGATTVGAMIVEPVLGEGGYVVPPVAWLAGLRERCDEHGILLVFDEVQCGFGRTGRPFAAEAFGVSPDVVLFAKGVASGMPLAGIIAGADLMARWPNGAHGTTFGGNPVSCAAAVATIEVLESEGLYDRALAIGEVVMGRLRALGAPVVVEVRGIGGMIGVELRDKAAAEAVQHACLSEGVIVLTCGPQGNVLRLIPPLTITDDELDHGLSALEQALLEAG